MSIASSSLRPGAASTADVQVSADRRERSLRRAGAACAALFILFGPAPGQVFGWHSPFLREWVMFSGSGVGVLKGAFTLRRPDGTLARMTPLAALGLDRYPSAPPYEFGHLVLEDGDLASYAAGLCAGAAPSTRVSFAGFVGTRQGWRALDAADVCASRAPLADTAALPRSAP